MSRAAVGSDGLTAQRAAGVDGPGPHEGLVRVADAVVERDQHGGGGAEQAQGQQGHHGDLKGHRGERDFAQLVNGWIGNEMMKGLDGCFVELRVFFFFFFCGVGGCIFVYINTCKYTHTHICIHLFTIPTSSWAKHIPASRHIHITRRCKNLFFLL